MADTNVNNNPNSSHTSEIKTRVVQIFNQTNLVNIKADSNVNNEKRHITEKGLGLVLFFIMPGTTLNSHL